MNQRMQTFELLRPRTVKNEWSESVTEYDRAGTVRVVLSVASGRTLEQNQALRVSSTHRGLTLDDVHTGDRFGGYKVDYVIKGIRYNQLFLTKEEGL